MSTQKEIICCCFFLGRIVLLPACEVRAWFTKRLCAPCCFFPRAFSWVSFCWYCRCTALAFVDVACGLCRWFEHDMKIVQSKISGWIQFFNFRDMFVKTLCYSSGKILAHRGGSEQTALQIRRGGGGGSCSVLRDEHMRVSCVLRVDQSPCCHDSLWPHIFLKTFVVVLFFFLLFISLSQYLFACVHERKFYGIQNVYFNLAVWNGSCFKAWEDLHNTRTSPGLPLSLSLQNRGDYGLPGQEKNNLRHSSLADARCIAREGFWASVGRLRRLSLLSAVSAWQNMKSVTWSDNHDDSWQKNKMAEPRIDACGNITNMYATVTDIVTRYSRRVCDPRVGRNLETL